MIVNAHLLSVALLDTSFVRRVVTLNSAAYEHSCFVLAQRRR